MNRETISLALLAGFIFMLALPIQAAELTNEELQAISQLFDRTARKSATLEVPEQKPIVSAGPVEELVETTSVVMNKKDETAQEIFLRISAPSLEERQLQTPPMANDQRPSLARRIKALPDGNITVHGGNAND